MNRRTLFRALRPAAILAALGLLCAPALHAQTAAGAAPTWTRLSVDLPSSDAIFPAGDGAALANGYCLMCHSAGMVLRQPPLGGAQWLAEIQKMRTFYGSPLAVADEAALAAYLARINGPAVARQAGK